MENHHSAFNVTGAEHAETGVDYAMVIRAIRVFRLRKGRRFTRAEVYRHSQGIKAWLYRAYRRIPQFGAIPDIDSIRVQHMQSEVEGHPDVLVVTYDLTRGWNPGFECYASSLSAGDDSEPDVNTIIASVLAQRAGAQYMDEEPDGLPN